MNWQESYTIYKMVKMNWQKQYTAYKMTKMNWQKTTSNLQDELTRDSIQLTKRPRWTDRRSCTTYKMASPQRRNVTTLMVGLKKGHIHKNRTQKWWTPEIYLGNAKNKKNKTRWPRWTDRRQYTAYRDDQDELTEDKVQLSGWQRWTDKRQTTTYRITKMDPVLRPESSEGMQKLGSYSAKFWNRSQHHLHYLT